MRDFKGRLVVAALLIGWPCSLGRAQVPFTVIALEGQQAPGLAPGSQSHFEGSWVRSVFSGVAINEYGKVAFRGRTADGRSGVWFGYPQNIALHIREDDTIPPQAIPASPPNTVDTIYSIALVDDGQLVTYLSTPNLMLGFSRCPGSAKFAALRGGTEALSSTGTIAIYSSSYLYYGNLSGIDPVVGPPERAPGFPTDFRFTSVASIPRVGGDDSVVFEALVRGPDGWPIDAVYSFDHEGLHLIGRSDIQLGPEDTPAFFKVEGLGVGEVDINALGQIAVQTPPGASANVWVGNPGAFSLVSAGPFDSINQVRLFDDGNVFINAELRYHPVGSGGLFYGAPNDLHEVIRLPARTVID